MQYGSHTGEQYSSMGLTSPLYAVSFTWVRLIGRFLRRKAIILLALWHVLFMWELHFVANFVSLLQA